MTDFIYRLEVKHGQDQRQVDADSWAEEEGWMVFYRKPPEGGRREYWRVRLDCVVAMETRKMP